MGKGRRYSKDNKLNLKKVAAVIIALIVIIMFVLILIKMIKANDKKNIKIIPTRYYTAYENGKWGVIDGEGKTIIKPTYDEMVIIPDKTKDVFVVTYNVNYNDETYESKAINSKNEELFKNYEKVEAVVNYNRQNSIFYYETCLKVSKNGKYGLIDFNGKQLIDCLYDEIKPVPYLKNSLITIKDEKCGLISSTGAVIINNEYNDISSLTDTYEDGYIVKNNSNQYGVIGTNKKVLVPVEYEEIENVRSGNIFIVKKEGKLNIYKSDENELISIDAQSVKSIDSNYITIEKEQKYGLIDVEGNQKLEPRYQDLTYAFSNYYIAKLDDNYGIIDEEGNEKVEFKYNRLSYRKDADFTEGEILGDINSELLDRNLQVKLTGIISEINTEKGYMRIRIGDAYKYYNFKFEEKNKQELFPENTLYLDKQDGKYGYKNKDGIVVVNYIYDDATEQNEFGYAAVKKDGKWGAIDSEGNIVVEASLDLVNNTIIDFIGNWHLAEDINSWYYVK